LQVVSRVAGLAYFHTKNANLGIFECRVGWKKFIPDVCSLVPPSTCLCVNRSLLSKYLHSFWDRYCIATLNLESCRIVQQFF
jgi:hypothetical protein